MHSHKKIYIFSTKTRVRSRLAYQKNAIFPFVSEFPRPHKVHSIEHTQTRKKFRSISDLLRLHQVQGKYHTQTRKSRNIETKIENQNIISVKFKKGVSRIHTSCSDGNGRILRK
jgi:hypothetical protein